MNFLTVQLYQIHPNFNCSMGTENQMRDINHVYPLLFQIIIYRVRGYTLGKNSLQECLVKDCRLLNNCLPKSFMSRYYLTTL